MAERGFARPREKKKVTEGKRKRFSMPERFCFTTAPRASERRQAAANAV
jgi:hypothetical protein